LRAICFESNIAKITCKSILVNLEEHNMAYHIFISHTGNDTPIAEAVRDSITAAFRGNIELFLAVSDILSATKWKAELKEQLDKSDAIISIITPDSINKPWIYVEWSPFWLHDKISYTLHTGDVALDALIHPMQDRQATNITNNEKVKGFFESLARNSNTKPIPYRFVDDFIATVKHAQEAKLNNAYSIYRLTLSDLPESDDERVKIAKFFYRGNEVDIFVRVAREIRSDLIKVDLICDVLKDSKLSHEQELEVTRSIAESINSADRLGEVAIQLIRFGNLDSRVLHEILEDLARRNKAELRKVAIHLINLDQEETELFVFVCSQMGNSNAEFRKILENLVTRGKFQSEYFLSLVDMFTNCAEIKNLALFMIIERQQRTSQFEKIVRQVLEKNQSHFKTIMKRLELDDIELYRKFREMFEE
jgi:TIR domain